MRYLYKQACDRLRHAKIAVLDGPAQIARLRYMLAQGPKSKLVASPKDWPGACSTPALLGRPEGAGDVPVARLGAAQRPAVEARPEAELDEDVAFTLTPLPVWADLDADVRRAKVAALTADIEVEYRADRVMGGTRCTNRVLPRAAA